MEKYKNKKSLLFAIPMSICNFRCHYCYLAQREECYQGIQPKMRYSPDEVRSALSTNRLGGGMLWKFLCRWRDLTYQGHRPLCEGILRRGTLCGGCHQPYDYAHA